MGWLTLLENVVILVIIEEKMVMSITVMMFYVFMIYDDFKIVAITIFGKINSLYDRRS